MKNIEDYRMILASASPRRRELLSQIGIEHEVIPSNKDEILPKMHPAKAAEALSRGKALDVAKDIDDKAVIIGADTVVAYAGEILGKPKNEEDAFRMLHMLQGEEHEVYTGVTFIVKENGREYIESFCESTKVMMYPASEEEIWAYIATGEPMDKAGAYGIQGRAAAFVKKIEGDYNNVVGLPIARLYQILKNL